MSFEPFAMERSCSLFSIDRSNLPPKRHPPEKALKTLAKTPNPARKSQWTPKTRLSHEERIDKYYIENLKEYVREILFENQKNKELIAANEAILVQLREEREEMQEALLEIFKKCEGERERKRRCPKCAQELDN